MATRAEKAFFVLEYARTQLIVTVSFQRDGCLCSAKRPGRPGPSEERVVRVREAFQCSTLKPTNRASLELDIPQATVWRILRKRLRVKPYRLQLLQALTDEDKTRRLQFCIDMVQHLEEYGFAEKLIFSDEATIHLYVKVNRHNVRIWGTENPHATIKHIRNSPKLNVFCAISKEKGYGQFFFSESTVTGTSYLDMMQEWLMPHLDDDFIYQQDGDPPHNHHLVRGYLNQHLPQRCIG
jgi:hypothetical protein